MNKIEEIKRNFELLLKAPTVAAKAHAGVMRKWGDGPYIGHPARVVMRLTYNLSDEDFLHKDYALMTAWLHDVVEDNPAYTLDTLRKLGFPEIVVDAVDSVTRRDGEMYFDFIDRAGRNLIGRLVKIEDIRDNIASLPESEKSMLDRYKKSLKRLGVVDAVG